RPAGRDGGRRHRPLRRVLRHDRGAGLRVAERGRQLGGDRAGPPCGAVDRGADPAVIRVVLPAHLRTLAQIDGREVSVMVEGPVTQAAILDALEATYPMLRGTIRDRATHKRR